LIKTGEYYIPDPPEVADYDLVNDSYGLNKASYLRQQKLYMRHWEDMLNNRAKLYALIWQYLSQESIAEVKRHQDVEVIKANRDVQRLWEIIEETHKVFTISRIAAIIKKISADASRPL
jgi:hypothetical protein